MAVEKRGCLRAVGVFVTLVLLLASVVVGLDINTFLERPVVPENEVIHVVIPPGTSWNGVIQILETQAMISRPLYFNIWGRRRGLPDRVRAGRYTFVGPVSLSELEASLQEGGAADEVTITIPEGLTIFHIADRLDKSGVVSRLDFLRAARNPETLQKFGIIGDSMEGYLFPDTYRFRLGVSADELVQKMYERHQKVWTTLVASHPDALGDLSKHGLTAPDVVILASLIEKESNARTERSRIARVFLNRIDKKMRLQTDPTCVYGEDTYREIPHPRYCKDPLNRYSTYVIDGLPPGPIANPGKGSLEAALLPSKIPEDKNYLFFVARRDGSGAHHFSNTFAEHRRAVRKFLK